MATISQMARAADPRTARSVHAMAPGTADTSTARGPDARAAVRPQLQEADLLDILDRGEPLSMPERALLLANAAGGGADAGDLPLGARDRLILRLHETLFGPMIEVRDTCPHCHGPASFEVGCSTLAAAGARRGDGTDMIDVRVGEYEVRCRPPRGVDLVAASRATDGSAARATLLAATIQQATRFGDEVRATTLPADVVEQVALRVSEADPLAEVRLVASCPACGGSWEALLDPAAFVWAELRDWGRRVLWEVHVLATAYGWPEHEILSLPPKRRKAYIGLVLDG